VVVTDGLEPPTPALCKYLQISIVWAENPGNKHFSVMMILNAIIALDKIIMVL